MEQLAKRRHARWGLITILAWSITIAVPLLALTADNPLVSLTALSPPCAYPASDAATPGPTPLRLLQYNVQFLLPNVALNFIAPDEIGHWPNTTERAQAIARAIAERCFDIVALNETVNRTRREEIVNALQRSTVGCGHPSGAEVGHPLYVAKGPALDHVLALRRVDDFLALLRDGQEATLDDPVVGDELTIISRLPIVETHAFIFSESAGIDVGAAKGVLHVRLRDGAGDAGSALLDVFATHLQAGDHDAIRRSQLAELAGFIRARSHPSVPRIVLGDFNIDGSPQAQADAQSAYRRTLQPWAEELGLEDTGRALSAGTDGESGERIDYIFFSGHGPDPGGGLDLVAAAVEPFFCADLGLSGCSESYPTLSDHAAVTAELLWRHGPTAGGPSCDGGGVGR